MVPGVFGHNGGTTESPADSHEESAAPTEKAEGPARRIIGDPRAIHSGLRSEYHSRRDPVSKPREREKKWFTAAAAALPIKIRGAANP